jgi:hypothetical protein
VSDLKFEIRNCNAHFESNSRRRRASAGCLDLAWELNIGHLRSANPRNSVRSSILRLQMWIARPICLRLFPLAVSLPPLTSCCADSSMVKSSISPGSPALYLADSCSSSFLWRLEQFRAPRTRCSATLARSDLSRHSSAYQVRSVLQKSILTVLPSPPTLASSDCSAVGGKSLSGSVSIKS